VLLVEGQHTIVHFVGILEEGRLRFQGDKIHSQDILEGDKTQLKKGHRKPEQHKHPREDFDRSHWVSQKDYRQGVVDTHWDRSTGGVEVVVVVGVVVVVVGVVEVAEVVGVVKDPLGSSLCMLSTICWLN